MFRAGRGTRLGDKDRRVRESRLVDNQLERRLLSGRTFEIRRGEKCCAECEESLGASAAWPEEKSVKPNGLLVPLG